MASLQDTIDIIIRAQDQASSVIGGVGNALSTIDEKVQAAATPFANLANRILAVEGAALAAAAALIKVSVDAAKDFDTSFREIGTLLNLSDDNLNKFRTSILDYAGNSAYALGEVTTATYNAISMGADWSDSLKTVEAAEKLAIAGKGDLNKTLELLVGTMNAYGVGMDQAERFSDVFFMTVKNGKTTIPELADSISRVTGTATLGGVSIEELTAAIATVTASGAPTSEAITRINSALSSIISPSKQASDLAKELGIDFSATALQTKGLSGVMAEVAEKTGGSAEKMAVLFGSTEALQAANILAITSSDKFAASLEDARKAAGSTTEAFEKMEPAVGKLKNSLDLALVAIGDPMVTQFRATENALTDLIRAFTSSANAGSLAPLTDEVNRALGEVQSLFDGMAQVLPDALKNVDWSPLTQSLAGLGDAVAETFNLLTGGLDLTTVEGMRQAIQTLVGVFSNLTIVTTGIVEAMGPAVEAISLAIQEFALLDDKQSLLTFGEFIGSAKLVVEAGTGLGLALVAIGQTSLSVAEAFNQMAAMVSLVPLSFTQNWSSIELIILGLQKKVLEATISIADFKAKFSFLPGEKTFWEGISEKASTALGSLAVDIAAAEKKNRDGAESFDSAWQRAMGNTESNFTALRSQLDKSAESLKGVGDKSDAAASSVRSFGSLKIDAIDLKVDNKDALDKVGKVKDNVLDLNDKGLSSILLNVETSETASRIERIIGLVDDVKTALTKVQSDGEGLGWIVPKDMVSDLNAVGIEISEWTDAAKGVELVFSNAGQGANKLSGDVTSLNETLDTSRIKTEMVDDGTGKLVASYSQIGEGTVKATGGISIINDAYGAQAKKVDEAIKQSEAYITKMEELASNERIKNMEFTANIVTTKLETDAERVKSLMEGISTTVESTGSTISALFSSLNDADSWSEKWNIENQIRSETEERKKALELQRRLAEAEIQRIQAQTRRLNQGDAMIKIEADGLEPEIEAFMWKILGKIQTRANASMQDYLLGIESAT